MRTFIIAILLSFIATGGPSAAEISDIGGGFSYEPTGNGQCRLLLDAKYGQPVFEFSKRAPSKVVLVGDKAECPFEYKGYKAIRIASGKVNGFIYTGLGYSGARIHIYRKAGSSFTFKYGPNPKKK